MGADETFVYFIGQSRTTNNGGYFGFNYSSSGSNTNYATIGIQGAATGIRFYYNRFNVNYTTISNSITSGSIVNKGGWGNAGAMNVGGELHATNTTASTSSTSGSMVVTGGIGLADTLQFPNSVLKKRIVLYDVGNAFQWVGIGHEADLIRFQIRGSDGAYGFTFINGEDSTTEEGMLNINGSRLYNTKIWATTNASSKTTGALIVDGGVGINNDLYVGTGIYLPNVGGGLTELNYYEHDTYTMSLFDSTGGDCSEDQLVSFVRIGRVVYLDIPPVVIDPCM